MVVFLHHNSFIPIDFLSLMNHLRAMVLFPVVTLLDCMVSLNTMNHSYEMVILGVINHLRYSVLFAYTILLDYMISCGF